MTRILLHACCGPCSLEPVRILREEGAEPVIFYANSNIHPADEYARRLETLRAWAEGENVEVVEGTYDAQAWEATVGRIGDATRSRFGVLHGPDPHAPQTREMGQYPRGVVPFRVSFSAQSAEGASRNGTTPLGYCPETENAPGTDSLSGIDSVGGDSSRPSRSDVRVAREARCRACYRLRFEEAARYAADHGFAALGTTLSVSPYQYTDIIREELERAAERAGIEAHFRDFRPFYDEATRRSREAGMYRQNYCGCRFSDEEAAAERAERKAARRAAREAERAAHADERAAEDAKRARNRAEKQAYAAKQAKKRAILKAMREQGSGNA